MNYFFQLATTDKQLLAASTCMTNGVRCKVSSCFRGDTFPPEKGNLFSCRKPIYHFLYYNVVMLLLRGWREEERRTPSETKEGTREWRVEGGSVDHEQEECD